ncbi:MAG: PAS domain-containing protein [Planctomycetes bacterium]|nr:PAS domain-containing protein [Planctomycetota bacterium]
MDVAEELSVEVSPEDRPNRRARRLSRRRAFGTKLLYTFAITLSAVTVAVFTVAGLLIRDTAREALEGELARRLEDTALLTAARLEGSPYIPQATGGLPRAQRLAREALRRELVAFQAKTRVSEIVVFAPNPDGGAPTILASSSDSADPRGRLLADEGAYSLAAEELRPTTSSLYRYPHAEGDERLVKGGYAPILGSDGTVLALVGVELPAEFQEAVREVVARFLVLAAFAALTVLAAAVLLVRHRVHVPIYRLVRAMKSAGGPEPAKVRWPDEIGVLTENYNDMVTGLREKDRELRELYARAQERAVYLQGYSNYFVAGVPTGVVAVDTSEQLTVLNPAARRILGCEGESGQPVGEVLGAQHQVALALRRALEGSRSDKVLIGIPGEEDQEQRPVELSCAPLYGEDGSLLGAAALVDDRTEVEQLRRAVSRNERLAAIGNLGAGLAHEIRNPLGAISGFAELIERREGQDAARLAGRLRGEVSALNTFLEQFLSFARDNSIRRELNDLRPILHESVDAALQAVGEGGLDAPGRFRVAFDIDGGLPQLSLDRALIRSAFTNVAQNALEAMGEGGELSIAVRVARETVTVRIRDTGPGIPAEDRERIFDPLFTTRAAGTGLGLAIVHKTLGAHGGKIGVREAPGGGAEFVIRLPLTGATVKTGERDTRETTWPKS